MQFSLYLARQYAAKKDYQNALCNYFTVLKTVADPAKRKAQFATEFTQTLFAFLEAGLCEDHNSALKIWKPCTELFEDYGPVYTIIGHHAYRIKCYKEAQEYISKAVEFSTGDDRISARANLTNMKSLLVDTWHFLMVNDQSRNERFQRALEAVVHENDMVFDIGTGTGILAMIAGRKAGRVVAVEENVVMHQIAREVIDKNGLYPKVLAFEFNSLEVQLAEKASVIVSETLDCCLFGEGILASFLDAHERLKSEQAVFIPSRATVRVALLESPSVYATHAIRIGNTEYRSKFVRPTFEPSEQDMSTVDASHLEPYWCCYPSDYPDVRLLSEWKEIQDVDFQDVQSIKRIVENGHGANSITSNKPGTVHAIVVSFSAVLYGDVTIDTREDTCWQWGVYPMGRPVIVREGDTVDFVNELFGLLSDQYHVSVIQPDAQFETLPYADFVNLNDYRLIEFLQNCIPAEAQQIHDITTLLSFTRGFSSSRPEVALAACQPDCSQIVHYTDVDVMVAPRADFYADHIVHCPLNGDGTLNEGVLTHVATARAYCPAARVVPEMVSIKGVLIESDWINERSRLVPSAHLGFDLSPFEPYSLCEYRDISMASCKHEQISDEFSVIDLDFNEPIQLHRSELPSFLRKSTVTRITVTKSGVCDGVLYHWMLDSFSTDYRNRAAFVFPKRMEVREGDVVEVSCDLYSGQLLVDARIVRVDEDSGMDQSSSSGSS